MQRDSGSCSYYLFRYVPDATDKPPLYYTKVCPVGKTEEGDAEYYIPSFESAYFYYDLTDEIPDMYYMATDCKARRIADPLVRQFYMPAGTFEIGQTTSRAVW